MAKTFTIAVYDCAQAFGGHEEGGWWYDTGSLVRVTRVMRNEALAYAYCRRLNKKLQSRVIGPNAGKYEYTSVLSDGELQARLFEDELPPKGFPDCRPHYE